MSLLVTTLPTAGVLAQDHVTIANGTLEGKQEVSGVRSFRGIPFAQAPLGELR
jgi:para-nitrobenzyl esterase